MTLSKEKTVQQEKYKYPYHYIPRYSEGRFQQHEYWGTGHRYLGNIHVLMEELKKIDFCSLIDIGCGDGRITREIKMRYPNAEICGIDYFGGAIALAKAMNPDMVDLFEVRDIFLDQEKKQYDVVTIINVLEQIEPSILRRFIHSAADYLKKDGYLIATIPHRNKEVFGAAYQHFDKALLEELFAEEFYEIRFVFFDHIKSKKLNLLHHLLGGYQAKHWIITNEIVNRKFFEMYLKKYLYTDEFHCGRIAIISQKR